MARIRTGRFKRKKAGRLARKAEKRIEEREARGGKEDTYRVIQSSIYTKDTKDPTPGGAGIYIWSYVPESQKEDELDVLERKMDEVQGMAKNKLNLKTYNWRYYAFSTQKMPSKQDYKREYAPQVILFVWDKDGIKEIERKVDASEDFEPDKEKLMQRA